MPLPKQIYEIFSIKVPSTGKKITFRPFTVKEEKMLLLAKESEDKTTILNAISAVISNCTGLSEHEINTLALYDIEYIFVQIRARSVGEIIELKMDCDNDPSHKPILVNVDLSKIEVVVDSAHKKTIPLYDNVGVIMRYPSLNDLDKMETLSIIESITLCIDSVYDDKEIYRRQDFTFQELVDFVESLSERQLKLIEDNFFKTMPSYSHTLLYVCPECGTEHKKIVTGFMSFFV